MSQIEDLAMDWNANKLAILNRIEAAEGHQERTDALLAILPVLSNTVEEMHDRMVAQEAAHEARAKRVEDLEKKVIILEERDTSNAKGTVAAVVGAGAVGGGAGNLTTILEWFGKFGG